MIKQKSHASRNREQLKRALQDEAGKRIDTVTIVAQVVV